MEDLISKLQAKQREKNMSDAAFAASLGISRTLWWRTQRTGQGGVPIGIKLLAGIVRNYPELTTDVLIFLTTDVTIGTRKVRKGNRKKRATPEEKAGKGDD